MENQTDTTMNIVAYARVSTLNQQRDETILQQEYALREYAETQGYNLLAVYMDEAVSGATEYDLRPGFCDLLYHLKSEPIDAVLIYSLDRLARDLRLQENIIFDLQSSYHVKLLSIAEPDLCSTDPERILFRQIKGSIWQYEKSQIAKRLRRGRVNKARNGGFAGGQTPLGFSCEEKELTINKEQAEIVKYIFTLHKRGKSLHGIARTLQKDGMPTKRGGRWYASTVRKILNNSLYRGTYSYAGVTCAKDELRLV